jgi:predicted transcriptional regulator
MKSILISIKPKWVAKILNGDKTIEIRKTMPKCDLPIDVYIYCTKSNNDYLVYKSVREMCDKGLCGNVVAKFTLNKVEKITPQMWTPKIEHEILEKSCLKENELFDYVCSHDGTEDKPFYAWHISNLEIFDKPKELSEFGKCQLLWNCVPHNCQECPALVRLTKAPQSWCYVEVEDNESRR